MKIARSGKIMDEFGLNQVGRFSYRESTGRYTIHWHGFQYDGYTWEGLNKWAIELDYQLWY
jgi:hypothetical protein